MTEPTLPPLPPERDMGRIRIAGSQATVLGYTAGQLRAYALAAIDPYRPPVAGYEGAVGSGTQLRLNFDTQDHMEAFFDWLTSRIDAAMRQENADLRARLAADEHPDLTDDQIIVVWESMPNRLIRKTDAVPFARAILAARQGKVQP